MQLASVNSVEEHNVLKAMMVQILAGKRLLFINIYP
jgi:hypothetical protein